MHQNNEACSLENVCSDVKSSIRSKLISIADTKLYNSLYELNRPVNMELYGILRLYSPIINNICACGNCNFCYGDDIESILERVKIITI